MTADQNIGPSPPYSCSVTAAIFNLQHYGRNEIKGKKDRHNNSAIRIQTWINLAKRADAKCTLALNSHTCISKSTGYEKTGNSWRLTDNSYSTNSEYNKVRQSLNLHMPLHRIKSRQNSHWQVQPDDTHLVVTLPAGVWLTKQGRDWCQPCDSRKRAISSSCKSKMQSHFQLVLGWNNGHKMNNIGMEKISWIFSSAPRFS